MTKPYRLLGNHQLVPVLIFSLLAHSVFSPVAAASFFDTFYWSIERKVESSDFKPSGSTIDASVSEEESATPQRCITGCELSNDEGIKPVDKSDADFENCMSEKLQNLQLSHCPRSSEETQDLFDVFFGNTTGGDCWHLQQLDQDTKSVIFLVLLLSNGCNSTAYTVSGNVTNDQIHNAEYGFPQGHEFDGESAVRNRLLHLNNSKLVFEFDVLVSASQLAQHFDREGLEKIDQWINELDLSFEEREELIQKILSHAHAHRRISRSNCVDSLEQQIYDVVSYIPVIGELWGLGSTIGYAATQCDGVAKERGIDFAISAALDIATVATLGTGTAAFQGLKAGLKAGLTYGVRAGLKTAAKVSGKVIKKVAVKSLKESTQWLKHPIKTLAGNAKDVIKTVRNIPNIVKTVGKTVKNIPKTIKNTAKGFKSYVDDLAELRKSRKALQKDIKVTTLNIQKWEYDVYTPQTKHKGNFNNKPIDSELNIGLCRKKRSPGSRNPCSLSDKAQGNLHDLIRRRAEKATQFREYNQKYLVPKLIKADVPLTIRKGHGFQQQTFSGAEKLDLVNTNIGKQSTKDIQNKHIFRSLQHYHDMAPSFTLPKADGSKLVSKAPIEVEMVIGGKPRKFVLTDSQMYNKKVKGQIFVTTADENFKVLGKTQTSSNYDSIVDELMGTDGLGTQRAKEILTAIEETPAMQAGRVWGNLQVSGKKVFSEQQERAAVELIAITQIAESALPDEKLINAMLQNTISPSKWGSRSGRVPGADKWARSVLRNVKDGKITWKEAFNRQDGIYTLAWKGGTERSRRIFAGRKRLKDEYFDIRAQTLDDISEPSDSEFEYLSNL